MFQFQIILHTILPPSGCQAKYKYLQKSLFLTQGRVSVLFDEIEAY